MIPHSKNQQQKKLLRYILILCVSMQLLLSDYRTRLPVLKKSFPVI